MKAVSALRFAAGDEPYTLVFDLLDSDLQPAPPAVGERRSRAAAVKEGLWGVLNRSGVTRQSHCPVWTNHPYGRLPDGSSVGRYCADGEVRFGFLLLVAYGNESERQESEQRLFKPGKAKPPVWTEAAIT
jgi:hypothetical protein